MWLLLFLFHIRCHINLRRPWQQLQPIGTYPCSSSHTQMASPWDAVVTTTCPRISTLVCVQLDHSLLLRLIGKRVHCGFKSFVRAHGVGGCCVGFLKGILRGVLLWHVDQGICDEVLFVSCLKRVTTDTKREGNPPGLNLKRTRRTWDGSDGPDTTGVRPRFSAIWAANASHFISSSPAANRCAFSHRPACKDVSGSV